MCVWGGSVGRSVGRWLHIRVRRLIFSNTHTHTHTRTHDNNIRPAVQCSAHARADENSASNTASPAMLGEYTKSTATKRTPDYFASVVCADMPDFVIGHRRRDRDLSMHEIHASATSQTAAALTRSIDRAMPLSNLASSSPFFETQTQPLPRLYPRIYIRRQCPMFRLNDALWNA